MFSIQKASSLICTIVVALSSVGSAAAQGLDLTVFVGKAFPIYDERLRLAPPTRVTFHVSGSVGCAPLTFSNS